MQIFTVFDSDFIPQDDGLLRNVFLTSVRANAYLQRLDLDNHEQAMEYVYGYVVEHTFAAMQQGLAPGEAPPAYSYHIASLTMQLKDGETFEMFFAAEFEYDVQERLINGRAESVPTVAATVTALLHEETGEHLRFVSDGQGRNLKPHWIKGDGRYLN